MMLDLVPIWLLTIIFYLSFWESSKGNVLSGFSRETEPMASENMCVLVCMHVFIYTIQRFIIGDWLM